tara:strand:- start:936 stop:1253 length:318 start_codon:yes stop_codon:yes gene_type:complete
MFLKVLLISIFGIFFSTTALAQMVVVQIAHQCYPTENLLETWKKNGELINYIANVSGAPGNPPGQAIVTINKENKAFTILYNIQAQDTQLSCIVLHGDNFIRVGE